MLLVLLDNFRLQVANLYYPCFLAHLFYFMPDKVKVLILKYFYQVRRVIWSLNYMLYEF